MRFVRTSEQTARIFAHSNKWLVFTTLSTWLWIVNRTIYIIQFSIISKGAVSWLRQWDIDIRLRRPAFDWLSLHHGIVVDKAALKLSFLLVLRFHSRHGSDKEIPTSHNEGMGSNPGQSIWVLCYHNDKYLSEFSCLILPVLFHQSPYSSSSNVILTRKKMKKLGDFPIKIFYRKFDVCAPVHHVWKRQEVTTWCNNYDLLP